MNEIPIFPHVAEAGAKALREGLEANLRDEEIAMSIYLAMDELLHVTYLAGGQERH